MAPRPMPRTVSLEPVGDLAGRIESVMVCDACSGGEWRVIMCPVKGDFVVLCLECVACGHRTKEINTEP